MIHKCSNFEPKSSQNRTVGWVFTQITLTNTTAKFYCNFIKIVLSISQKQWQKWEKYFQVKIIVHFLNINYRMLILLLTEVNEKPSISFPLILWHGHDTGHIIPLLAVLFLQRNGETLVLLIQRCLCVSMCHVHVKEGLILHMDFSFMIVYFDWSL